MEETIKNLTKYMEAEDEAFKEEGIEVGTVTFKCPICGGEAVGNRYRYGGSIHGLGSGCKDCGIMHT